MTREEFEIQLALMRSSARAVSGSVQEYWNTGSRKSLEDIETYAAAAEAASLACEEWHA